MKEIPLTQGMIALVDDEDYAWLKEWKWKVLSPTLLYACRVSRSEDGKRHTILMHREILRLKKGEIADHKDGNGLNNQKYNLRKCKPHQNSANCKLYSNNRNGSKGIKKSYHKWHAEIGYKRKRYYLGSFATAEEATEAYNKAATRLFGEFVRQ